MSHKAYVTALGLTRDLEILTALSQDLAKRIPQGRPMVDVLARMSSDSGAIAHDLHGRRGEQDVGIRIRRRVHNLVETLANEYERTLVLTESSVWRLGDNGPRTRFFLANFGLAHNRADELEGLLGSMAGTIYGSKARLDLDLAGDLVKSSEPHAVEDAEPTGVGSPPRRQALRLVDVIVRVLPPDQRARYSEELRAELYGLAEKNWRYGAQLLYVARQFNRVFELRHELRRPSPRKSNP